MNNEKRMKAIKKASWIGIGGNGILAFLKIVAGFMVSSFALVGDGIDSLTDVITSTVTLLTASIAARPPDLEHPYGHGRAETIATKLLSFVIFFAGAQLAFTAVKNIAAQKTQAIPDPVAFVILGISIAGKLALSLYKQKVGTTFNSSMLIADAKNMRNDILISGSVLIGILGTIIFKLPILDSITALFVSLWILKTAFSIFQETSVELMDGVKDPDLYRQIFSIAKTIPEVGNPHKTRIRKLNNVYIIDMDIEVDGDLSVREGHKLATKLEKALKEQMENIYDVNVHIEPKGNIEKQETYGIHEGLL